MPFLEHMAELRRRLTVVFAVLSVLTIGLYFFAEPIYRILLAKVAFMLGENGQSFTFSPLEAMTLKFKIGLWAAVVVGSPIIIWQTFAFFLPALKPRERAFFLPTFLTAVLLFFGGAAFCYFIVLAPSMEWLIDQNGTIFQFLPKGTDVLTVVTFFLMGFGLAFETPIVVFYLVYFGVVPYKKLRENWRVVWVVIVIVAAMVTPDWSPVSMGALAAAMLGLYEVSMFLVRIVLARKIARQSLEESA